MTRLLAVAIMTIAGCARTLSPAEAEERATRNARYEQQNEQRAQRDAALHAYCLEHPLECEQADQARRDAIVRSLFGPSPYPTQTKTSCTRYGNSAECTTTQR